MLLTFQYRKNPVLFYSRHHSSSQLPVLTEASRHLLPQLLVMQGFPTVPLAQRLLPEVLLGFPFLGTAAATGISHLPRPAQGNTAVSKEKMKQKPSAEFLFHHPQPNSVIVSSSSKTRCQHCTPPVKEGKKLDSFGRRLYSVGALGIKSCNYMACMAHYIHAIFEDLMIRSQALCRRPCWGKTRSKSAEHTLETSPKMLTTAVAIRRHSWLNSSSLALGMKSLVEDLPFDGLGLFKANTDIILQ